jgi:ATP-dependent DNA helicase RecG
MKCAVRNGGGDVVPTNAGLLFFGREPQMPVIQSEVACVLYRDAVGASRYADRKFIRDTIQELIVGTEAFLNRYIAVGARIEGWKRIDVPEYSIEVLREAVVNAVVHRDYRNAVRVCVCFTIPTVWRCGVPGCFCRG